MSSCRLYVRTILSNRKINLMLIICHDWPRKSPKKSPSQYFLKLILTLYNEHKVNFPTSYNCNNAQNNVAQDQNLRTTYTTDLQKVLQAGYLTHRASSQFELCLISRGEDTQMTSMHGRPYGTQTIDNILGINKNIVAFAHGD